MAAIVLKAVFETLKHVFYHILGALFEQMIEAAIQKRRRKRKKARTKDLVPADHTECHTIRSCEQSFARDAVNGACIILGDPFQRGARVVILIDDRTVNRHQ